MSEHGHPVAENLLGRHFEIGDANKVWGSDFTYVHTKRGWAYVAVTLDIGTRKVVGWNVSPTQDQELVLGALRTAVAQSAPGPGLLHHSDRGTQYAAHAFQEALTTFGMTCSMSRKGNCWDNAPVESFFSTMKAELTEGRLFEDWREVQDAAFKYIAAYYNTRRPHSTLGYLTPNEYERSRQT
jgi:putative transposase